MLSIPYLDKEGYPLTVRFRNLTDGGPKYLSLKGDPPRPYNIQAIHNAADTLEICEGEFDAMILTQMGLHAIAIPGAKLWSGAMRRMCSGFSTIRVWADGDDAGAELGSKITRGLRQARMMRLPQGRDVTDVFLKGGEDALRQIAGIEK